jgi:hypothetical protein
MSSNELSVTRAQDVLKAGVSVLETGFDLRERLYPGESPGLSRSGKQERPPSQALVLERPRPGSDGH